MTTRLTKKQKGFVKDYIKTDNGTESALAHYDTNDKNVAAAIASENLNKPKIIKAIEDALPDDLLHKVHREGLFATKPTYNDKGDVIAEDTDFNTRHKYLDTAYKLKGSYAAEKHLNVNVEVEASPEIKKLTEELNAIHRGTSERSNGRIASIVDTETQDKD